jgi:hypothetical protein
MLKQMKKLHLILFITFISFFLCAEETKKTRKELWVEKGIEYLKKFKPNQKTKLAKRIVLKEMIGYHIYHRNIIKFNNNKWIFFIMHSIHDDEMIANRKMHIGDIILAIDQDGNIYRNDGHVCGGIFLETKKNTIDAILATEIRKDGKTKAKWIKIKL